MELPSFRYHPDPIKTGVIEISDRICVVCERQRGYIYTSHVYSEKDYHDCICPWCIADGSAHEKLNALFFDDAAVGGGVWDEVSQEIVDMITTRTPGFSGWQQERWFTHCHDAAAFLGRAGYEELTDYGSDAIESIRDDTRIGDDDEWEDFFEKLDKDGSPTAYLFRCLHCGAYGGYTDCD